MAVLYAPARPPRTLSAEVIGDGIKAFGRPIIVGMECKRIICHCLLHAPTIVMKYPFKVRVQHFNHHAIKFKSLNIRRRLFSTSDWYLNLLAI